VPPANHYYEVLWWLTARIAEQRGDAKLADAARAALEPARGEIVGGTTAMLSFGPL
jgi:hypothetical protein